MADSTKVRLIKMLEKSKEQYISGNSLANELTVSRNAIWKAVKSLRMDGYTIMAATNKGYRLESSGDTLTKEGIVSHLKNIGIFNVEVRKTVTSTNTVLREIAAKGVPEGFVLAAEGQTAGKGRMGREFHSPVGHGVYFSLLLRPQLWAGDAALMTSAAAVAATQAIEDITGIHAGIKWVNDLYVKGKKVCGILTEAEFSMESGLIESVLLGIGINVTRPEKELPRALKEIAGTLTEKTEVNNSERCRIIASTLDYFWKYYQNLSAREFLTEYRARSIVIGQDIYVIERDGKRPAKAIAINDNCELTVRYETGETETLNSGEVSLMIRRGS